MEKCQAIDWNHPSFILDLKGKFQKRILVMEGLLNMQHDQVAEQGFLLNDSLVVRVEVELRDDGPGQPRSGLTLPERRAQLAQLVRSGWVDGQTVKVGAHVLL